jgi:hypothetical protein
MIGRALAIFQSLCIGTPAFSKFDWFTCMMPTEEDESRHSLFTFGGVLDTLLKTPSSSTESSINNRIWDHLNGLPFPFVLTTPILSATASHSIASFAQEDSDLWLAKLKALKHLLHGLLCSPLLPHDTDREYLARQLASSFLQALSQSDHDQVIEFQHAGQVPLYRIRPDHLPDGNDPLVLALDELLLPPVEAAVHEDSVYMIGTDGSVRSDTRSRLPTGGGAAVVVAKLSSDTL